MPCIFLCCVLIDELAKWRAATMVLIAVWASLWRF